MVRTETIDLELVRELTYNLRSYIAPHIDRWLQIAHSKGVTPDETRLAVVLEALLLASISHVGSDQLFLRMAQSAIEDVRESPPTEH